MALDFKERGQQPNGLLTKQCKIIYIYIVTLFLGHLSARGRKETLGLWWRELRAALWRPGGRQGRALKDTIDKRKNFGFSFQLCALLDLEVSAKVQASHLGNFVVEDKQVVT